MRIFHSNIHLMVIVIFPMLFSYVLSADTIFVTNNTDQTLFIRFYYQQSTSTDATNAGPVAQLKPGDTATMIRPERKSYGMMRYYDRNLVASRDVTALENTLSRKKLLNLAVINAGTLKGNRFYFALKNKIITGYNSTDWLIVKPTLDLVQTLTQPFSDYTTDQLKKHIRSTYKAPTSNPYQGIVASVTRGNQLSHEEQTYLKNRMPMITAAQEKFLGISLAKRTTPKIALVFSGGGYRAMISTLGMLAGMQETGLLQASMWAVGLSGSCWALALLTASGLESVKEFNAQLFPTLNKNITSISPQEVQLIVDALLVKWAFNEPITIVDIYGALLANRFFAYKGNDRHRIYLSQISRANKTHTILPIFTAIQTNQGDKEPRWYEFSPYQIGSAELGLYASPWAFNRTFEHGISQDFAPEQNLGFFMGMFGSAFSAPFEKIYQAISESIHNKTVKTILNDIFKKMSAIITKEDTEHLGKQRTRYSWAEVNNFAFGLLGSSIDNQRIIKLTDAGIDFNLPYPPISGERPERRADIIILCDFSANIRSHSALSGAEAYARRKNLPFPTIDYTRLSSHAITVFKDEINPNVPVVIYIPLIRDETLWQRYKNDPQFSLYNANLATFDPEKCTEQDFCSTTNFEYSLTQAQQLALYNEFVIKACRKTIIDTMRWIIEKRTLTH